MKKKDKFENLPKNSDTNEDKDRRLFRLIYTLNKLNSGPVTVQELAAEFNVDKRSVQRDLSIIRISGYELENPDKSVYKFAPGISLKDTSLSNEQLGSLMMLYDVSKNIGGKIHESFTQLFEKLTKNAPWSDGKIIPLMPRLANTREIPFIDDIENAMEYNKEIEIEYFLESKDAIVKHRICPLRILFSEGFNYLFSMYNNDPKERFPRFRMDKIKSVRLTGNEFTPPDDLDKFTEKARNIWGAVHEKNRKINVILKINSWARDYFFYQELVGGQKVKLDKDGTLTFEAKLCQLEEIIPHIMRNLPCVEVVETKELKDKIKTKLRESLKLY